MKRTLIFTLLVTLLISSLLSVSVFAVEETEVSLVPENFGISSNAATKNALIWNDDESVTAKNVALFGIALPETVHKGDSVVVHIKGVSDGDFRVWLLGAGEATCSNQYKFSEHGYTSGEFDKIIEFTFQDFDKRGLSSATDLCFKGPSYGVNLANLTVTYLSVAYCTMDEYSAGAVDELDGVIESAEAAVQNVYNVTGGEEAFNKAVSDAKDIIDELYRQSELGYTSLSDIADELTEKLDDAIDSSLVNALSDYVKIIEDCHEKAKTETDEKLFSEYYAAAKEAAMYINKAAIGYVKASARSCELKALVAEIKAICDGEYVGETPAENEPAETEDVSDKGCSSAVVFPYILVFTAIFGTAVIKKK